jgi:hypothetical protein
MFGGRPTGLAGRFTFAGGRFTGGLKLGRVVTLDLAEPRDAKPPPPPPRRIPPPRIPPPRR